MFFSRPPARLTLGLLVPYFGFNNSYSWPICLSAIAAAEALDVNLIYFSDVDLNRLQVEQAHAQPLTPAGGQDELSTERLAQVVSQPNFGPLNRGAVQQISRRNLDGLIVINPNAAVEMADLFAGLPFVNIAAEVAGAVTSLVVDNYAGMSAAAHHLIAVHHCRRLAFIQGLQGNQEAELRYQAYLDALAAHQLPFDPALVFLGNFEPEAGAAAVRAFFQERQLAPEAILAANDNMALGALQALADLHRAVPYEVAVAGFDNSAASHHAIPTLTTVTQPVARLGYRAVELLVTHLRGGTVPSV